MMTFCYDGLRVTCIFTLVLHSYMVMDAISVVWAFIGSTPEAVKNVRVMVTDEEWRTDGSTRVVYRLMAGAVPVVLRCGLEDVEVHHLPWAYFQNAGRVSTPVTVIWG